MTDPILDLERLREACLGLDSTMRSLVDRAVPLTEYAWKFRYPGEHAGPTRAEAESALAIAREAFEAMLA